MVKAIRASNIFVASALGFCAFNVWHSLSLEPCQYQEPSNLIAQREIQRDEFSTHPTSTNEAAVAVANTNLDHEFTIGICAIVKDMEAYLDEWLDYHLVAMNIDTIYLYDHSPQFYLKKWYENTRNHTIYSRVNVIFWGIDDNLAQRKAYEDCIKRFGKIKNDVNPELSSTATNNNTTFPKMDYFALIDVDEFLVPKQNYTSIHGVVKDYLEPYGGALVANWVMFGSANKTLYKPIPMLKRFQYRSENPMGVIKTIVKASDFSGEVRNPHAVKLRSGKVVRTTKSRGSMQQEQFGSTGASTKPAFPFENNPLLIHHFRYLSAKEYNEKSCTRGQVSGPHKCNLKYMRTYTSIEASAAGKPTHFAAVPGTVFDDSAWKLLRDRVPKYRVFDDELSWGDYT